MMTRIDSEDGFQALQVVLLCGIGFFFIVVLQRGGLDPVLDFLRVRGSDLHPVLGWRY